MGQQNGEYEYIIYDPNEKTEIIPYSQTPYVPDSVVKAVQSIYTENERFVYLTKYLGNETVIHLPESIGNIPVRAVNCFGLKRYSFIQSIFVPRNICFFHINSLKGCVNLTELKFEDKTNRRIISGEIIKNCKKLFINGFFTLNGCIYAAADFRDTEEITIPDNVTEIGDNCFAYQAHFKKIRIPKTVTRIGASSFFACQQLEQIVIEGTPIFDNSPFSLCAMLKNISLGGSIQLSNPYNYLLSDCSAMETFDIPDGTIKIGRFFHTCKSLKEVNIPNSVQEIEPFAFYDCNSLRSLILPASVRKIRKDAFHSCRNLKSIICLSDILEIESNAFIDCSQVMLFGKVALKTEFQKTGLPYSIVEFTPGYGRFVSLAYRNIEAYACDDSVSKKIDSDSEGSNYPEIDCKFRKRTEFFKRRPLYDLYTAEKYFVSKEKAVEEIIKEDPECTTDAFAFAVARINESAMSLSENACENYLHFWKALCNSVQLPEVQKRIIEELSNLKGQSAPMLRIASAAVVDAKTRVLELIAQQNPDGNITVDAQLRNYSALEQYKIEHDLFATNPELFQKYIKIPKDMCLNPMKIVLTSADDTTYIQQSAVPEENNTDAEKTAASFKISSDGMSVEFLPGIAVIEESVFEDSKIRSVSIPEGVTEIARYAFQNCSKLESVSLPSTLEKIGMCAFSGCSSLREIDLPESVKSIEMDAFRDCISLINFKFPPLVTYLADYTLARCCSLEQTSIPPTVTHIGAGCFNHCETLRKICLPEAVRHIEYSAFEDCSQLENITFPKNVETFQGRMVKGCTKLKNIKLPDSIVSIGKRMFKECKCLEEVMIPYGVRKIGEEAFMDCNMIKKISIPDSVEEIQKNAFVGCVQLKNLILPADINKLNGNPFPQHPDFKLFVKKNSKTETLLIRRKIPYVHL